MLCYAFERFVATVNDIYLYLKRGHARDVTERGSRHCTPPTVRICHRIPILPYCLACQKIFYLPQYMASQMQYAQNTRMSGRFLQYASQHFLAILTHNSLRSGYITSHCQREGEHRQMTALWLNSKLHTLSFYSNFAQTFKVKAML